MSLQATLLDEIIAIATALKDAEPDPKHLLRATQALLAASGKKSKNEEPSTEHLQGFFDKCLIKGEGYKIPKTDLWRNYEDWWQTTNTTPIIHKTLSIWLRAHATDGTMKVGGKVATAWIGICLKPLP